MMPSKMRYRLGVDLGTTSIGWCLIRLNTKNQPIAIIRMGVRIFSDGRNPKDGTSLAVTRRLARQMRRRRDRLLRRKSRIMDALIKLSFFPKNATQRHELLLLDPYALRKRGLDQPLTGPEFARALFHINQRRGFRSNRKTDKKDSESGALKKAIKILDEKLKKENCRTLGEWLANRHEKGKSVRARLRGKKKKDKTYDFYADRTMIEHEFDTLWDRQSGFNPELFTNAAREKLKDILLYQRPLKPVKPGRCTLLPDEERAPLALPSVQLFRIYQELNSLRLLNSDLTEKPPLTKPQRDLLAKVLTQGNNLTFKAGIKKRLKLEGTIKFNLSDGKRDKLKGSATSTILAKPECFGERWFEFNLVMQDTIVEHLLNEPSEAEAIKWLRDNTGVDEFTAKHLSDISLPEGYGSLSRAALARILPELINDVVVYSEAVTRAGFASHSVLSHAKQTGEIMEALPYYGIPLTRHVAFPKDNPRNDEERYGKIANPTVHIGLNELRKVVNALIRRYGHPSEVIIEVARDLKWGQKRKQEIQREQKVRQDLNEKHVAEACRILGLTPANLNRAKRRELSQKMQLWVELNPKDVANRRCPYTGEQISIERLLSNEIEIEHILPYSMTLDDSMNNKTVSLRRANRDKGNRTPYEAFNDHPGYDYGDILERATLMYRAKTRRFAPDAYQNWLRNDQDFLARALNDTAYLSRISQEYLSLICPGQVRAIPGRMTALLRGKFGLNKLLSNTPYKNRTDHRHHALDAAVIAITDQGMLQRFAKASASTREKQLGRLVEEMPLPWATYREHVERALNNIIVSHRPDHSYQGAMHEASAWGFRDNGMTTRRKLSESDESHQREIKKQKLIPITSTHCAQRHGLDEQDNPKPYKGYVGGNNYCIEIWRDEVGKWKGDVISTFQAYQVIRQNGEVEGIKKLRHPKLTQSGKPLAMRLMINDIVCIKIDSENRIMRVVKISSAGQMFFAAHNEANVDARNRDKENPFTYISKYPGSLKSIQGRHVTISVIGELHDPGFRG
jgi:CRISPR-associated endonuclease Csn1